MPLELVAGQNGDRPLFAGMAKQRFGSPDVRLGWREHDMDRVRVWREDWPGDVFEVMHKRVIADLWLLGYDVRRPLGVCEDDYDESE